MYIFIYIHIFIYTYISIIIYIYKHIIFYRYDVNLPSLYQAAGITSAASSSVPETSAQRSTEAAATRRSTQTAELQQFRARRHLPKGEEIAI